MIQTQLYNDFSSFDYFQRRDYDFMMEQIKAFINNGGDITLMVKFDKDKPLIKWQDFIADNIENSDKFFQELTLGKLIPSICDMKWLPENGTIEENEEHGVRWMKSNYSDFRDMIYQSIEKLIAQLPKDLSKIKRFGEYSDGNIFYREQSRGHPLYTIATKIDQTDIYELIFKNFPDIKAEWEVPSYLGKPRFSETIKNHYDRIDCPSMAVFYYKHGIGQKYLHNPQNKDLLLPLIRYAAGEGEVEFLKQILPHIKLGELEKGKYEHEISLPKAANTEIVNLLLDHNAVIAQNVGHNTTDALFSDSVRTVEVFDAILQRSPMHIKMIQENPDDIYYHIGRTNFKITQLLIEKYQFPLEKYDMLIIAYEKKGDYEWLIKNGADTRQCATFCEKMVSKRDDGLKEIRALAKQGLITPKSPDMVFNIFASKPTKLFLTYYDKITSSDLEKTTLAGYPAWWGATSTTDYSFMFRRISKPEQTAQDGKPLFFFALERLLSEPKLGHVRLLIEQQLKYIHRKDPDYKLDLSYSDNKGNNFLHYHVEMREYGKNNIDGELLKYLKEHSIQNPYEFYAQKNHAGISPLEILLTQETKNTWNQEHALKDLLDSGAELIKFSDKFTDGKTVGEHLMKHYEKNPEISSKIHALVLEQELNTNTTSSVRKIKI